ncbi:MAG: OmpH family outer membrane protein [Treponema sp.]|jgi:outer membrane protein|nr:OmpH family outer membrane protein [Treponema sp.]
MKKRVLLLVLLSVSCVLYAQQLTRIAVIDMPKVYTAYFRDSRLVRQFEEKSAKVQSDIDRMTKEIQELRSKHADALLRDDQTEVLRLETLITRRSEYLKEFYQTKTAELENEKRKLMQSGSFLDQVYDEIRYIAESEGYSMVFDLKQFPAILWYSNTIDVTDKLIANLQKKSR